MLNLDEFAGWEQSGQKSEEVLAALHDRGLTITEAIKAVMHRFGLGLGDAKSLVTSDPSWIPTAQAAAPFQDELVRLVQSGQGLGPTPSVIGVAHNSGVPGGSRQSL